MEAKIQYLVELDKVVSETRKLLPSTADWTYELNAMTTFLDKENPEVTSSIIESVRQSMYVVDQRLADCQAILNGYLSARNKNQSEPQTADLDKLENIANMLQPQEDPDDTIS